MPRRINRSRADPAKPPDQPQDGWRDPHAHGACWLCERPLGRRIEWHHPVPKSRGGRATVAVHPICHRTLHATFANAELARIGDAPQDLRGHPDVAPFLGWLRNKPADFHARTSPRRSRR